MTNVELYRQASRLGALEGMLDGLERQANFTSFSASGLERISPDLTNVEDLVREAAKLISQATRKVKQVVNDLDNQAVLRDYQAQES